MRVVLFGTGAMACLFGARLSTVCDITLVGTWKEAISAIEKRGLLFEDNADTRRVRIRAQFLGSDPVSADLVIVLVKSWQTRTVASYLPKYLGHNGVAVSLQNGLGNVGLLGPRAYHGTTGEGATLLGPGHVRSGGAGETVTTAPSWTVELLQKAGFEARRCSAEEADSLMWGKLCINCGINALTGLLRVKNGELLEIPGVRELMVQAAEECARVAQAKGINLSFTNAADQVKAIAQKTAGNRSSMFQDIIRGVPTESDWIYGPVVREGERTGVGTPVNRILWALMQAVGKSDRRNS